MKPVYTSLFALGALAVGAAALFAVGGRSGGDNAARAPSAPERLERGRYLVHNVGMCIDCHSPRDERGQFIEGKHLAGAPLAFAPTVSMPWMPVAPPIAGLPTGYSLADTVHFLMTGERPGGRPAPLPPMPPYRFDREDAESLAAYLHSLGSP